MLQVVAAALGQFETKPTRDGAQLELLKKVDDAVTDNVGVHIKESCLKDPF